jgi:hypothetical protein
MNLISRSVKYFLPFKGIFYLFLHFDVQPVLQEITET